MKTAKEYLYEDINKTFKEWVLNNFEFSAESFVPTAEIVKMFNLFMDSGTRFNAKKLLPMILGCKKSFKKAAKEIVINGEKKRVRGIIGIVKLKKPKKKYTAVVKEASQYDVEEKSYLR